MLALLVMTVLWTGGAQSRDEEFVKSHINYLGQYYAGHGEFPWVVEIRTHDGEDWTMQEEWAIGNLIGPRFVVTTCNAVATFRLVGATTERYLVIPKIPFQYKVLYSPDYPYHGPWWYINRFAQWRQHDSRLKMGSRTISRMMPHPYCNCNTFKYYWGMVELGSEPIRPFRNFINYAPAELDATSLFKRWYRIKHTSVWKGAMMSTWGRDYSDKYSQKTMLFNYKLKYQIKYLEWAECERHVSKMGWGDWNPKLVWVNNTFCMSLYDPDHTMGAICDHDRGAPIVWEGYFVGVVVTGAHITHCSNLDPLPFVVQSLEDAQLYWTNVQRQILSYFIPKNTHLFPGLTGIVVTANERSGVSRCSPAQTVGGLTLLIILVLLILNAV